MNRREFFKMIFGAGAACVLLGVVEVVPEVERVPSVTTLTEKQLEWLRKKFAESNCFSGASIRTACVPPARPLVWESTPIHLDPAWTPDETAIVMLNNNGTIAGLIHNIGS